MANDESPPTERGPRYAHDCARCVFDGRRGRYDTYICPDLDGFRTEDTVILRYGDAGDAYKSRPRHVHIKDPMGFPDAEVFSAVFDRYPEELPVRPVRPVRPLAAPLALLLEVTGPDGRPSDWALAVLDPDTLGVIDRRRTAYARAKAEDRQYYEAYYFDARAVDFLANSDADDTDDGDVDPADAQDARDALDVVAGGVGNGSVALDEPGYAKLSQHPMARVECVQMIVRESGLMWMCYPKHGDTEMRTAEIPWAAMGMEAIRVDE